MLGRSEIEVFQKPEDLARRSGLLKGIHQVRILEESGNACQRFEMIRGRIFRCYQEEENERRPVIQRIEIHSFGAFAETRDQMVQTVKFPVRDGNASSNTCAAQVFSFEEGFKQTLPIKVGMCCANGSNEFRKNIFFGTGI